MPRQPREHGDGYWYHVYSRGGRRRDIFIDDHDRTYFLELLGVISRRFGVEIHAYCLLANHYHLVVHAPGGNIGKAMHYLGTLYAQRFNQRHGYDGQLCGGRYKSRIITNDEGFLQVVRYVTANAVRHRLVCEVGNYPWSSFHGYMSVRPEPSWLVTETVLGLFGSDRSAYHAFLAAYEPPARHDPSIGEIEAVTASVTSTPVAELCAGRQGARGSDGRSLLFLLAADEAQIPPRQLAERYGLSASTVRSTLQRARRRLAEGEALAARHREAINSLRATRRRT